MNIIVCLKQILDPEIPVRDFRVDAEKREAVRGNANLVTNIFCENALETALQFKEKFGGKITALIFAPDSGEDSLRKALAMKADAAVLVKNDGASNPDPLAVAQVLAAAIRKLGEFDLVMTGRESGDWGVGQTGGLLAEELGVPAVSFVDQLEKNGDSLLIKRQTDNGWERLEATPPLVVTVTNNDQNVPRIPKTRDIMMSSRQPITKWSLDEIGVNAADIRAGGSYYEVVELAIPVKDVNCEFVSGDTLEQKVEQLAQRIIAVTRAL
ncbi:MAG TPA: electron transfer flavoprotein subunit beta/FixA family protein [Blastocatellia bacterium]|nr:electron transfer flavoprotein subunit beta/FixA family protein [Blastocatellia bacterium]HMX25578.1 electron transfer flavoprotein subunit beta/FixA family protein [Blastocatellia bacterium]HMZ20338.1 electron transfer flavoprotein subunit beta/FixA family protein [Blastocatellia bacterium]HNG32846.1 electron transfer flavoprotein subunit beta/FixA family protein [Blastocatellia bacterium]